MVSTCSAYGCTNRKTKRRTEIHFHAFPFSRAEILMKWILAVRRKDWKPTKCNFICSAHFLPDDYEPRIGACHYILKKDAVPSVFSYSDHIQMPEKKQPLFQPNVIFLKGQHDHIGDHVLTMKKDYVPSVFNNSEHNQMPEKKQTLLQHNIILVKKVNLKNLIHVIETGSSAQVKESSRTNNAAQNTQNAVLTSPESSAEEVKIPSNLPGPNERIFRSTKLFKRKTLQQQTECYHKFNKARIKNS